MYSREVYPLSKEDEAHADWFVAVLSVGLFATPESATSARKNRDSYAEHHRLRRINELQSRQPYQPTPLQQSILKGFVGFRK